METTPPGRALHPLRGLLLLALANLFIWLAWNCLTTALCSRIGGLPHEIWAFHWSIGQGEAAMCGIVAALVPRRRFVGLAWATGIGLLLGAIHATELTVVALWQWGEWLDSEKLLLRIAVRADQTVTMFVLVQALRFACGWRLAVSDESMLGQRGQFRLGDLLEWTVSVSMWLAISRFIKVPFFFEYVYPFILAITGPDIVLLPIALAATSKRGLRPAVVGALFIWTVTVELLWCVLEYVQNPDAFFKGPWGLYVSTFAWGIGGWLLTTGVNFAIIRRLGFRWCSIPTSSG